MITQTISNLLFYLFAMVALLFAIATVTTSRILRSAVYLMVVLLSTAALYAYLGSYFLSGLQILVYVGGIVVLLVFAVMLTHTNQLIEEPPTLNRKICGLIGALMFAGTTSYVLLNENFNVISNSPVAAQDAAALGRSFLDYHENGYAVPFEIISLLLLAAIIGGIVVARKTSSSQEVPR